MSKCLFHFFLSCEFYVFQFKIIPQYTCEWTFLWAMRCNRKKYVVIWKENIDHLENFEKKQLVKETTLIVGRNNDIGHLLPFELRMKYFLRPCNKKRCLGIMFKWNTLYTLCFMHKFHLVSYMRQDGTFVCSRKKWIFKCMFGVNIQKYINTLMTVESTIFIPVAHN